MSREAMKLALEALEKINARSVIMGSGGDYRDGQLDALSAVSKDAAPAITALREALDKMAENERELGIQMQPAQQEPVAWMQDSIELYVQDRPSEYYTIPLYTSPAQRTWVGLTDEEKQEWIDAMPYDPEPRHCMILVNVIEAKLKEKNA